jgi:uncharacterized membrane protein YcaP (DUF421 family)
MNAFDFIVTVALGSIFASTVLAEETPIVEGLTALVLLVSFQYVITSVAVRFPRFRRLIKSDAVLLYYRGEFLEQAMRKARVTRGEIMAAARLENLASMDEVDAVVLENQGSLAIMSRADTGSLSLLESIPDWPRDFESKGEASRD